MVDCLRIVSAPTFEVSNTIVFRKSTTRPTLSVNLPSSRICRSMFITSGWAFSTSSNKMTEYGFRRTCSVN